MASRALVLSGGGFVGIASESGLLAGLSERGVDRARGPRRRHLYRFHAGGARKVARHRDSKPESA